MTEMKALLPRAEPPATRTRSLRISKMGGLLWIQTTLDSLPGLSVINVKEGGEVPEKRCDFYSRVKGVLV